MLGSRCLGGSVALGNGVVLRMRGRGLDLFALDGDVVAFVLDGEVVSFMLGEGIDLFAFAEEVGSSASRSGISLVTSGRGVVSFILDEEIVWESEDIVLSGERRGVPRLCRAKRSAEARNKLVKGRTDSSIIVSR